MKGVVLKRKVVHMTSLRYCHVSPLGGSEQSEEVREERWGMDALNIQTWVDSNSEPECTSNCLSRDAPIPLFFQTK